MLRRNAKPAALDRTRAKQNLLDAVVKTLTRIVAIGDTVRSAVLTELARQPGPQVRQWRKMSGIYEAVTAKLAMPETPLLGMGFAANPAAFDETGLLWWYGDDDRRKFKPLRVTTKPTNLAFYDYTTTRWWRQSIMDEQHHIYGPYVDHSGTNAYILTFSRGVSYKESMVGLVVLDVLVGQLQSLWQPQLLKLPKPSSVVDEDGVVIATNSGSLLGGAIHSKNAATDTPVPSTGWRIVTE